MLLGSPTDELEKLKRRGVQCFPKKAFGCLSVLCRAQEETPGCSFRLTCVLGYLANLFLKEAVLTLVLQAIKYAQPEYVWNRRPDI